jgi:DNA invertase Pin-like site-specific DNA recombinase
MSKILTCFAEVLYAIAGWVARMKSQIRSERTKAGMDRARATLY